MLSVKPFSSATSAGSYYAHGDYYGEEGEGLWFGDGAKELGLEGSFQPKQDKTFSNLLKGMLPNGDVLGRNTKDGVEHRPGIDLTFSAPKSFSIQMMLYASDKERQAMEKALLTATQKTLTYIEKEGYVITRKGRNGVIKEPSTNLIFSQFLHTTNRNLEPQAHVHCFLANAAKGSDGKYRSIVPDKILENNKFFGQIFRNELALETKKLGFEIKQTILSDKSTAFELSHIPDELIKAFSTRRKEIEDLCKALGITSKEGRDKIVITSRKAKQKVAFSELKETWSQIEKDVMHRLEQRSPQERMVAVSENHLTPRDLALLAIENASYHESVFSKETLLKSTLGYAVGDATIDQIQRELTQLEKEGFLIGKNNEFTTKSLLKKEAFILSCAEKSKEIAKPLLKASAVKRAIEQFEKRQGPQAPQMNLEQKAAITHMLTSKDQIVTMTGLPGVGKSTTLEAVRDISGRKIMSLIGLGEKFKGAAPTASAAKTLGEKAGVKSQTLHSFLAKHKGYIEGRGSALSVKAKQKEFKKTMIFVDEGSLISTNMMHQLLTLQQRFKFRLVLTGDTKQLGSVEAGKPFKQILSVIKPKVISTIVRQRSETDREAIREVAEGNIEKSFSIHQKQIKSLEKTKMAKTIAQAYCAKDIRTQKETLLISPTRKMRDNINREIVQSLYAKSTTNQPVSHTALIQKDMSVADFRFAPSYAPGDVIRFHTNFKKDIKRDEYVKVVSSDPISNSLMLEKDKKQIFFQLNKRTDYSERLEVFETKELKLQEGLKIIFTKNQTRDGLINPETAYIVKIEDKKITLRLENGMLKTISKTRLRHIDYGYAVTVHTSQGKTYKHTLAAITVNKHLNNQKSWLVSLSRHQHNLTIYTDNKEKLQQHLTQNKGESRSGMEFVGERGNTGKSEIKLESM